MSGWTLSMAWALALSVAVSAAPAQQSAPAPPPPAADAKTPPAIRTQFDNGDPIDDFFTALAVRFGVMVVQPQPVKAYILKSFELPATLNEALAIARQTLEPQGYSILQSVAEKRLIIRIVTTAEAKKAELAESPVSFGAEGEKIDISNPDRQVTHLLPINHPDMIESLRRTAMQDPEVSAEITGGTVIGANLILTGPALKVQRAVESIAKLDKLVGGPIVARTLTLQHLSAQTTANALNQGFAQDAAPMKAVVDLRTNSLVITGPEDRVMEILVTLVVQDAKRGPILPPRSIPAFTQPARPSALPPLPATLPALPATQPSPATPGASGGASNPRPQTLDEMPRRGDNPALRAGLTLRAIQADLSLFVNMGAFS